MRFFLNITVAYVSFGIGTVVGSIIASVVAGAILSQFMSLEDLERIDEAGEVSGSCGG